MSLQAGLQDQGQELVCVSLKVELCAVMIAGCAYSCHPTSTHFDMYVAMYF